MTPIWYEFEEDIYNLALVSVIKKQEYNLTIRLFYTSQDETFFDVDCDNEKHLNEEFEKIRALLKLTD